MEVTMPYKKFRNIHDAAQDLKALLEQITVAQSADPAKAGRLTVSALAKARCMLASLNEA
jgi:hypothetical protein